MIITSSPLQWSDLWFILQGIGNTLIVSVIAGIAGTLLGGLLGWAREVSLIARIVAAPLVDVVRAVPLIIQFILTGSFLSIAGFPMDPVFFGTIVLSLYMGVLTSELVRAGLAAVPEQMRKSARSLGMTYLQEMFWISLPTAIRTSLPGWIGLVLGLIKDTSLLGVVGYVELLRATRILDARTHQTLLLLVGVGIFYFIICYPVSRYSRLIEGKLLK